MTIRTACFSVGAVALALPAFADNKPITLDRAGALRQVQPTKAAPCVKINGKVQRTGEWVDLGVVTRNPPTVYAFDSYEDDGTGFPTEDGFCNIPPAGPTQRYFGGLQYNDPFVANDMTVGAGANGAMCEGVYFAWFWNIDEVGGAPYDDTDLDPLHEPDQDCLIAIFTTQDFDTPPDTTGGCDDNGDTSIIPGVVYTFANLNDGYTVATASGGYYYTNIDLSGSGLAHEMPADGIGGHQIVIASGEDVNGALILTGGPGDIWGQPMLHGTGEDEVGNPNTRVGTQDALAFDDDNPTDGVHTLVCATPGGPGEGYNYAFGVCPDPLGYMIAFLYKDIPNPCPCPGDVNGDGIRDINDLTLFLSAFGLPATNCADINGDGLVDINDLTLFLSGFGVPCP